jgi:hypothetical protein
VRRYDEHGAHHYRLHKPKTKVRQINRNDKDIRILFDEFRLLLDKQNMSSAAPSARLLAGRQLSSHITSFAHSIRTSAEAATHATTGVGSEIPHIQNYPQKQPVRAKYGHCRFTPTDDRQLLGCHSYEELCGAIESIILETGYSRRSVIERAKALEVWAKFAPHRRITTIQEKVSVQKLLARSDVEVDLLSVVASKLN